MANFLLFSFMVVVTHGCSLRKLPDGIRLYQSHGHLVFDHHAYSLNEVCKLRLARDRLEGYVQSYLSPFHTQPATLMDLDESCKHNTLFCINHKDTVVVAVQRLCDNVTLLMLANTLHLVRVNTPLSQIRHDPVAEVLYHRSSHGLAYIGVAEWLDAVSHSIASGQTGATPTLEPLASPNLDAAVTDFAVHGGVFFTVRNGKLEIIRHNMSICVSKTNSFRLPLLPFEHQTRYDGQNVLEFVTVLILLIVGVAVTFASVKFDFVKRKTVFRNPPSVWHTRV